ncbi:MAG: fatty acid desaturase [bacterium]|nr:fatty acid desaturase [bacterium]
MPPLITRIHGKYYDVGAFEHPGGCPALECARDRDATALFESYHALHRAKPLHALEQYEIPAEKAEGPDRFRAEERFGEDAFDWDATLKSPFRQDLMDCATRYLQEERTRRRLPSLRAAAKAPPRRWLEIAALGAAFFGSLPWLVQGSWIALVVTPLLGWLFMVNFWHDALHFALSRNWRINRTIPYLFPWFISPKMWMHQHVIAHHIFTNDPKRDPDIRAEPRILRQTPSTAWCPVHGKQGRIVRLLVLYALPLIIRHVLRDHVMRIRGWFNDAVPLVINPRWRRWVHMVGRVAVAVNLLAWPFFFFPFGKALAFAFLPSLILSEVFLLFSQVNHATEINLEAGETPSSNWYESQVRASCSFGMDSYIAFILSGGLNLQIEHHLFPGINHAHLFKLSPQIRAICEKHGVPYHSYPTFGTALRAHFATMKWLGKQPEVVAPPAQD